MSEERVRVSFETWVATGQEFPVWSPYEAFEAAALLLAILQQDGDKRTAVVRPAE